MKKTVGNNTTIYYLYKLLSNSAMRGPILVTFMTTFCKMPLYEVYFCEACCVTFLAILQIPMGALADSWGRSKTVRIGCLILVVELVCFACSREHILLWIGNAFWALGTSLVSGADSALIYDSLKQTSTNKAELETRYRKMEGRSSAYSMTLTALLCLTCGYFAQIDIRIPVIVDTLIMLLAFTITFAFTEPNIGISEQVKINYRHHMKESISQIMSQKHILWIISFSTLIGVTSKLWFFTYNPYFESVGLDLKYFGLAFFTLNVVCAISSHYADQICRRIENPTGVLLSILIITISIIAMGVFISKWSIGLIFFQNLVRGYLSPFVNNMLHKRIGSENRATILSVKSAIYQGFEVAAMALFGFIVSSHNLATAIIYLGIISSLIGAILTFYYSRLFRE